MVNNNQQQNFEENFKKNFAAAKKMSEERKREKQKKADSLAQEILSTHYDLLVEKSLSQIGKKLSSQSGDEIKFEVSIKDLTENDLLAIEKLQSKVCSEVEDKISALVGKDAFTLEVDAVRPTCGWFQSINFVFTFSF